MRKIIFFVIFLAIATGLVGLYYYQRNVYSKGDLKLEILGPTETDLLDEVEYVVTFKNNGNIDLEQPELIFEYPDNSLVDGQKAQRVVKGVNDLGEAIYPGVEKSFHFKARLIGKEGTVEEAKVLLNYQPHNLKARYQSETSLNTVIKQVPLTFQFDLPSKIDSGKETKFRLNYFSNLNYPLSNLRISIEYPANFEFVKSSPNALDNTEWDIGLLNKAEGGRIEITGALRGSVGDQKIFKATIGIWQEGEFIPLKEVSQGVTINKPSLYVTQQINGSPGYIANPGDTLHYQISFENLGSDLLNNLSLIVKLQGNAFDLSTLQAPQGAFQTGDNSVIFEWQKNPKLQFLDINEEGEVDFWIHLKKEWPIVQGGDTNPTITTNISLGQNLEQFVTKVNSSLVITQKGYFNDEVFGNSGPMPPRVGQPTTFTVIWQAKNYYNDVNNVKVKATLPANVDLTGQIFPEDQASKFTFDKNSREIVWNVGDLKATEGISGTVAPNISFQVKLTPTAGQLGQSPQIISETTISGDDQWTSQTLNSTSPAITTLLPDDTTLTNEMKIVK